MDVQTDPDLDDFSNMYKSNNNYGEFIVSLNKINGSLGFSLRSDPEDTTALRLVLLKPGHLRSFHQKFDCSINNPELFYQVET
jgi:hypothetical protein